MLSETRVIGEIDDLINLETDDLTTIYTYTPAPTLSSDPPKALVASVTAPDGVLTEFEYNNIGRVTKTTYAVGTADEAFTSATYCSCGGIASRAVSPVCWPSYGPNARSMTHAVASEMIAVARAIGRPTPR